MRLPISSQVLLQSRTFVLSYYRRRTILKLTGVGQRETFSEVGPTRKGAHIVHYPRETTETKKQTYFTSVNLNLNFISLTKRKNSLNYYKKFKENGGGS